MKTNKKQQIINLYENENLSCDLIAHKCNCEVSYVKSVISRYEEYLSNNYLD